MTHTPDRWVVVRLSGEAGTVDKVMSGWSGGYLHGDSWRLNSGISQIEEKEDRWLVTGPNGTEYELRKGSEGTTGLMASILSGFEKTGVAVEVVDIADARLLA